MVEETEKGRMFHNKHAMTNHIFDKSNDTFRIIRTLFKPYTFESLSQNEASNFKMELLRIDSTIFDVLKTK